MRPGAIPESVSAHAEVRALLDGEARRGTFGFSAETEFRVLWIPFGVTKSPVSALIACRQFGLLRTKLDNMSPAAAIYIEMTTLVKPVLEN